MPIKFEFAPPQPVAGQAAQVTITLDPPAAKSFVLRSPGIRFDPSIVDLAGGATAATFTIPANRKNPIAVSAIEVDAAGQEIPGGETDEIMVDIVQEDPFADEELDKLREKSDQAQKEAARQKAQVTERENAAKLLSTAGKGYDKALKDFSELKARLGKVTEELTTKSKLSDESKKGIRDARAKEDNGIKELLDGIKKLEGDISTEEAGLEDKREIVAKEQSEFDLISKGLEKDLLAQMKLLSDLEKKSQDAGADLVAGYFYGLEMTSELNNVKEKPDTPLVPTSVYALNSSTVKSLFTAAWTDLQTAKSDQVRVEENVRQLSERLREKQAELANRRKNREQNILAAIKRPPGG